MRPSCLGKSVRMNAPIATCIIVHKLHSNARCSATCILRFHAR
ncbi:Uncharacterized protein ToN1_43210 [Aromatoleum petrolei]|nr:Uncharacterized protein ToN1_43210 [Aromatoleum petrolei]